MYSKILFLLYFADALTSLDRSAYKIYGCYSRSASSSRYKPAQVLCFRRDKEKHQGVGVKGAPRWPPVNFLTGFVLMSYRREHLRMYQLAFAQERAGSVNQQ
jgi:hypothetical protein